MKQTISITWVEREDPKQAACLGLDQRIDVDIHVTVDQGYLDNLRLDAEHHAECDGVDLEKYMPVIEVETCEDE